MATGLYSIRLWIVVLVTSIYELTGFLGALLICKILKHVPTLKYSLSSTHGLLLDEAAS